MDIFTTYIPLKTNGNSDIIDITNAVRSRLDRYNLTEGYVILFVQGSTGALTTMEFETNLAQDVKDMFDRLIPPNVDYAHHMTWGDDNGHSHLRASLLGSSITVPFVNKKLTLGTWQQLVFIDFDTSSRNRKLVMQVIGN